MKLVQVFATDWPRPLGRWGTWTQTLRQQMRRKIGLLKRFRFGHEALQGWPVERAEATERDVAADWEDPGYGHEIEILAVTDTDKRPVELSSGEMDFVIEIITMNHSIEGRQR